MKLGEWRMAKRNLARNKRRNFATGIAIALGFAALLALSAYTNRVRNYLRVYTVYATRVGHLTLYKKGGLEHFSVKPRAYSLTEQDQQVIHTVLAGMDSVEISGPQILGAGLVGNGCRTFPFLATGIDPQLDKQLREHAEMQRWAPKLQANIKGRSLWAYPEDLGAIALSEGLVRFLHKAKVHDDFPADQKTVIVSDCQAKDADEKLAGDANVQLAAGSWSGMMSALDGEVVAHIQTGVTETNNSAILTSFKHLQKLYDTGNATFYSVWLKDGDQLAVAQSELKAKLDQAGLQVDIYLWTDEAVSPFYTGTMQFLYTMVSFISIVLATVIVFSVFNSATMTVIERSQEIGMMRSLGFNRRQIRGLFVMETLLLAGLALAAGAVLGFFGVWAVNLAKVPYNPPGIAGGMTLTLIHHPALATASALLILLLAVTTTLVAVRTVVKGNIANLVLGTQR